MFLAKKSNNRLLTEHEGRFGKCWLEVVAVRTKRSEVRTKTTNLKNNVVYAMLSEQYHVK